MADALNPGRELAKLRWRSTVVDRAVETITARVDELTEAQRMHLRVLADGKRKAN